MRSMKHKLCPYCQKKLGIGKKIFLFSGRYAKLCPFCGRKIKYKKLTNLQGIVVLIVVILNMFILKNFPLLRRWLIVPYTIATLIGTYYAEWIGVDDES